MTESLHPFRLEESPGTHVPGCHGHEQVGAQNAADQVARHPLAIALYGQFGCGNFGNEGSLEAMLAFLRRDVPQARLFCIAVDPEAVRLQHNIAAIAIGSAAPSRSPSGTFGRYLQGLLRRARNWAHALRHTRRLDLLLVPGTGILDDFSTGPWGVPYALFRWCLAARLQGARIAFVSIGAGPIRHPLSRWFMASAARLAHYRSYRDEISREYMRSIGFPVGADPVTPDIAFLLPDPMPTEPAPDPAGLTVGIGVMAYYGWSNNATQGQAIYDTYIGKISQFVQWLLDSGHRVRLLTGEAVDGRAVQDVLRLVAPTGHITAEPAGSLQDVMRQIVKTDLVVATRFHNVVCALKLGKPTVSLGYARKNDVLLAEMGLGDFCQSVEDFEIEKLKAQFLALQAHRGTYRQRILNTVKAYRGRLEEQEEWLLTRVIRP